MLILAVDPGLHKSGWCILRDGKVELSGVVSIPQKCIKDDAILAMSTKIYDKCSVWKMEGYVFDLMIIEKQYLGRNADSTSKTAIVAGAWICAATPKRLMRVAPATWGAAFSLPGTREEKKAMAVEIANILYPHAWKEDEAEAFLMAMWGHREVPRGA